MFVVTSQPPIRPMAGETYRQFVPRAHMALMRQLPDPDERNDAVWKSWYSVHGDPQGERAAKLFPDSEYRTVRNVPYFMEHATRGRAGEVVSWDFDKLADVVDEHSERADTDSYTAMTDGHTVERPAVIPANYTPPPEPAVVGYAGPYRLGMVGHEKPKYAVFADEHHLLSEVPKLDKKKRRSVEINRFKDGRRPFIDPVAILGSTVPRLALPVARYAVEGDDGAIKERYEAPVSVSGTNYLVEPIKDRHSAESSNVAVDPQIVQQFVQAVFTTPEFQFLRTLMNQQGSAQSAGGAAPTIPGAQQPVADSPVSQPPGPPSAGPMPPIGDDEGMPGGAPGAHGMTNPKEQYSARMQYSAEHDDSLVERFSILHDQHTEIVERYAQLEEVNRANMAEMARMRSAVVQLEQRAVDAERTERIKELYQLHPHFIDLNEELEVCLYSHGAEMGAEAFERHVERLEKLAKRASPVTRMLPGGDSPLQMDETERHSADFAKRVVDRYTLEADAGNVMTYAQVEALVKKEMAGR